MTIFRFSLAVAAVLLTSCGKPAAVLDSNEATGTPVATPAPAAPAEAPSPAPVATAVKPHPLAGTDKPTATYDRCMETGDAGRGVTLGMMNCIGEEIDRQDARLNADYKTLMALLDPAQQDALRTLQRAWIPQRDRRCAAEAEPNEGGTLAGIVYSQCILDATIERAQWLETYEPGTK